MRVKLTICACVCVCANIQILLYKLHATPPTLDDELHDSFDKYTEALHEMIDMCVQEDPLRR